jgi:hypothetical protein
MTPSALRVYPPQTLLEERMRLAAHVCAATTHCCDKVRETFPTVPGGGRTPEKPSQPSPEEGARRDELALRRQWHLGSSRDRGGRRQCHVGIAAGAASVMSGQSGSLRAPPGRQWHVGIAAGLRCVRVCRSRFVRTTWGFPGLRALRPTCAERRDRSRTSTRCFARASRRTVATAHSPAGPALC